MAWAWGGRHLAGGVDKIELSPDQVREIIQGLQEPKKFPPTDEPESSVTKELTVLKHHCRLGDYAGRVFNDLKLHNTDAPLPKLATELVELLGEEDSDGPMALAIDDITYRIRNQGGDIDSAMAKFAVQAYAARNHVCHGEAGHLVIAEKWDDLAQRISLDLEALPEILPEGQIQQLETWRRILCYYRDRYTVQNSNGKWQKREEESLVQLPDTVSTPGDRSIHDLPPLVAKYRFEMGHFRADPVPFSSLRLLTDRGRAGSLPSVESPKRKASGPPEGDSAPESPSKKPKKPQDPKSPPTAENLHAKAAMIQTAKVELGIHELTKQTTVAALGDGAEEEGGLVVGGEEDVVMEDAGEGLEVLVFEGEGEEGSEEVEEEDDSEREGFW
ncbi:hypothetical protein B0J14DRAFT_671481 [Halenospora varia]|nr:hypothetical protein B0J14DRAFT_671481 [Halenospora varia]